MKKYRCIKEFNIPDYDEDGFIIENQFSCIVKGEVWEVVEVPYNFIASYDAIHLENGKGAWMEIYQETLNEYFELIADTTD